MIRWKRTARNNWYYAPKVYDTLEAAYSYATMWSVEKYNQRAPYAIEVVRIEPTTVWGANNDESIQRTIVEPSVQQDG